MQATLKSERNLKNYGVENPRMREFMNIDPLMAIKVC